MKREIKFRGISSDTGKWIYGSYHKPFEDVEQIIEIIKSNASQMSSVVFGNCGQFTGLTDKNGKEIYEGDIINHNNKNFVCGWSDIMGICFVEINKNLGSFIKDGILMTNHNRRSYFEITSYVKYCEVIGNIHENNELLK